MKAMMLGGAAAMVAGGMYLHGDFRGGALYAMPAAQVKTSIDDLTPHHSLLNMNSTLSGGDLRVEQQPSADLAWAFYRDGKRIGSVAARVRDEAPRARVNVEVVEEKGLAASEGHDIVKRYLKAVVKPVMAEQIDARLEGRTPDQAVIMNAVTGFVMADLGSFQRDAMGRAASAVRDSGGSGQIGGGVSSDPRYQELKRKAMNHAAQQTVRTDGSPMSDARPTNWP